ncbi:FAD-dependent pyridine nucleotide-disulfide oxidoreductase, putative (macronuclear) [Tetrahymena thermophila SB210]|uniref:FAD-dependent pyridine nucleotide-disulfide oxidoreductase, putative n=1 Tax=Tetrahymena thermophila (strain SB210) TaxID=312017 RepID=Q23AI8_TETTS|nr:FAD-dependent pyridine nucleotide-disulfide oxidoreductase, putative [Tetrahymena thermophila SB210]EAR93504.2 FAD-dependent pyridine nucleotide-disulfide oxidoreductase, putative [Tetrahymena thermophila SB210]|eukprot:XP_001013749.2 FAD-dependent pyridine nucleotide-disulfide oxidoreductase, putative [Tetrahymena thermophila SB210]
MFKFTQKSLAFGANKANNILRGIQNQRFATKKVVPSNLDQYDVIIIGSNMGAVLARHINEITNGRNTVFVASSSSIREQHHLRVAYELGSCKKENFILDTKSIITPFIPHSDGVRVKEIHPESNTVVLENDRTIQYKRLVISTGLQNNFEAIPGLKDAVYDQDHPAFSPYDVTGKQASVKDPYYWYNFYGGKCIFYIPKFPIRGEIQEYNFLVAYDQWVENQKNMSQKIDIEFTIVNANDSFSQYSKQADEYFKEELKKRGIKVLYNTQIENIDKPKRQVTVVGKNGGKTVEKYDNLYSIIPTKGHEFLQQANLCNEQGLLSVDSHTLQHKKYKNIFGFGDIIDVPTTRSFFGTQEQLNVVRQNVIRSLHGQSLTAQYFGQSKTPLYIGKNKLTFVSQNYDKPSKFSMLDKEGRHLCYLRNFIYSHFYQYINTAYYKFAIWGKPYFLWPKTYHSSSKGVQNVSETHTEHSEKKDVKQSNKTGQQFVYKPQAQFACLDVISPEIQAQYFVVKDPSKSVQNIFKNELNEQQKQAKEQEDRVKKAEQEQKKKEQQLKREKEEKEQKEREEEYRKKKEQEELERKRQEEEQEKKRQLELQRQKEEQERQKKIEQERLQQEEQEKLKKQEQERLRQQQLQEEEALKKQQQLEKEKQEELEKQQKQQEEAEVDAKQEDEQPQQPASNPSSESESPKKRKGRPKKEKKE